jgi:predicted AlkP superfamily pyrophosphatase or phosphodiesterase
MATALVDTLNLGRGPATDYLAISFSALDLMGHDFGPDSREAEDLLMRLDVTLGELLQKLDVVVGRDNYVVALTADHGAAPVPEQVGGGRIASEDVRQALEQALVGRWGAPADGTYVAWVGPGDVYLSGGFYERARRDKTAMQTIVGVLDAIPGVRRVLTGDEVTATSPDPIVRAAAAGRVANRSGDLLIVPERNWVFELRSEYDATNHGTFHEYDRRVPVVLRGHGIRAGRYRDAASPADIAPTLAALAGVALPRAEGRVLREALVSR